VLASNKVEGRLDHAIKQLGATVITGHNTTSKKKMHSFVTTIQTNHGVAHSLT